MAPVAPLPRLEDRDYPLEDVLTAWARDVGDRNKVAADKDRLATWVRERC